MAASPAAARRAPTRADCFGLAERLASARAGIVTRRSRPFSRSRSDADADETPPVIGSVGKRYRKIAASVAVGKRFGTITNQRRQAVAAGTAAKVLVIK